MSSPATGSETPAATDAPAGQAVTPPVTPPVQPPAQPPAQGDSTRGLLAAVNALPEKIANVLLERAPVATNTGAPQSAVPAQGEGASSPGTAAAPANTGSTPGQGTNSGGPPPVAAGAASSKSGNKFTDWWFGG